MKNTLLSFIAVLLLAGAASAVYNWSVTSHAGGVGVDSGDHRWYVVAESGGDEDSGSYEWYVGLMYEQVALNSSNTSVDISGELNASGALFTDYNASSTTMNGFYNVSKTLTDTMVGRLNVFTNLTIFSDWTPNQSDSTDDFVAGETKLWQINATAPTPYSLNHVVSLTELSIYNKYVDEFTINVTIPEAASHEIVVPIPTSDLPHWDERAGGTSGEVDNATTGVSVNENSTHVFFTVSTDYGGGTSLTKGTYVGELIYYWQRSAGTGGGGGGGASEPTTTLQESSVVDFVIESPQVITPTPFQDSLPGSSFKTPVTVRNRESSALTFTVRFACSENATNCPAGWMRVVNKTERNVTALSITRGGALTFDVLTDIPITASSKETYVGLMQVEGCVDGTNICQMKTLPVRVEITLSKMALFNTVTHSFLLNRVPGACVRQPVHVFGDHDFTCVRVWMLLVPTLAFMSLYSLNNYRTRRPQRSVDAVAGSVGVVLLAVTVLLLI